MATQVILGNRPARFKSFPVKFAMPEGGEGQIMATYKYRTREQYGEWLDAVMAAAREKDATAAAVEAPVQANFSVAKLLKDMNISAADTIMDSLEVWDVAGRELTRENVHQLADEIPAAANALVDSYRSACRDGRLGNF